MRLRLVWRVHEGALPFTSDGLEWIEYHSFPIGLSIRRWGSRSGESHNSGCISCCGDVIALPLHVFPRPQWLPYTFVWPLYLCNYYVYISYHIYIYISFFVYIERERERERVGLGN